MRYGRLVALLATTIMMATPFSAFADENETETSTASTPMATEQETRQPEPEPAPATEAPATEQQTQPPTEAQTQPATEAQTQPATEAPAPATEAPAPATETPATERQTQPATEAPKETGSETKETEPQVQETEAPQDERSYPTETFDGTTSDFDLDEEFRFTLTEDFEEILVREGTELKEDVSEDARTVAIAKGICKAKVLEDEAKIEDEGEEVKNPNKEAGDYWLYVESGEARGFMKRRDAVETKMAEAMFKGKKDGDFPTFSLLMNPADNAATEHSDATTEENVVAGVRMKASAAVGILEGKSDDSRKIGAMEVGTVCYALEDAGDGWLYVESGDVRGFVRTSAVQTSGSEPEDGEKLAEELIPPSENAALRKTMKSTKKADEVGRTRRALVDFALQFVGNPYVWGGTSLTNGADCSGFAQSVFAHFGISLPRVADQQALAGPRIPVSEAKPGDLIFYAYGGGYVGHVSIYIGDGQVVHAANTRSGIITSGIYGNACWAVNMLG